MATRERQPTPMGIAAGFLFWVALLCSTASTRGKWRSDRMLPQAITCSGWATSQCHRFKTTTRRSPTAGSSTAPFIIVTPHNVLKVESALLTTTRLNSTSTASSTRFRSQTFAADRSALSPIFLPGSTFHTCACTKLGNSLSLSSDNAERCAVVRSSSCLCGTDWRDWNIIPLSFRSFFHYLALSLAPILLPLLYFSISLSHSLLCSHLLVKFFSYNCKPHINRMHIQTARLSPALCQCSEHYWITSRSFLRIILNYFFFILLFCCLPQSTHYVQAPSLFSNSSVALLFCENSMWPKVLFQSCQWWKGVFLLYGNGCMPRILGKADSKKKPKKKKKKPANYMHADISLNLAEKKICPLQV